MIAGPVFFRNFKKKVYAFLTLGVMIVVAAFVLGRGQIEARIVGRMGTEDPDGMEDSREAASRNKAGVSSGKES